jgi:hypothetical protein
MDSWKTAFSSTNSFEANLAKNYLESDGIEALLQNELAARVYASMIDKPKLLVREKDIEQAIKILIKGAYIKN